jgi:fructose-bisphosphate aldolase, class II
MPIATSEQYPEMLDAAAAGGYALAAVNVSSSETLNAAMRGLAEAEADGIIQVTAGAAEFYSGGAVSDPYLGAAALAAAARVLGERYPVLIGLHTDHAPPELVDSFVRALLAESRARSARHEEPLFNSHTFDGSTLPIEENLRVAAELLGEAADLGVALEVVVVGGEEDELLRVAQTLGTGERGRYLLATNFGNVQGVNATGAVELGPEALAAGQSALRALSPGARFQYVVRGSSGSRPEELAAAIAQGVVKVNVDTDMQFAFTRAVARHVLDEYDGILTLAGDAGRQAAFDPRAWGRKGEAAMAARTAEAATRLGAAGRSLLL